MKSYILFRSGVFVLGLIRVRSPLPGWLAAASVARALLVLSLLRGDPSFRLYLGWERSERLAAFSPTWMRVARLGKRRRKKKRITASRRSKACIVALLEPVCSDDSRARGRDILFASAERRNEKEKVSHRSWFLAVDEVGRHVG